MLSKTHLMFSVLMFLLIIGSFKGQLLFLIFLFIGTLFVDIDSKNSKFGKKWFLRPLQWSVSHRGIFHTLFMGLFIGILIWLISKNAGYGFMFGYGFHLLLDCFNPSGVNLFWPILKTKITFMNIRAGGEIENIFFVLMLLLNVFLIFRIIF
jgi:inner membrane protein